MGNVVFNVAKGRVTELFRRVAGNDPANSAIIVLLLKTVQADATLIDYDTLSDILTAGGGTVNVESDATNYVRKTLDQATIVNPTVDDTNDWIQAFITDQVWTALGGATNNNLVKLLICYDSDTTGGTDANIIPLVALDFVIATNGGNITGDEGANGIYRAA